MEAISNIRRDFIASHLRSQINRLHGVLLNIEEDSEVDCQYTGESLKGIEVSLRQIRKLCIEGI